MPHKPVKVNILQGYLRVGRTLQGSKKEEHKETAMAIYQRGIKKVGHQDPNLKVSCCIKNKTS
jgi:hypothetical protein